MRPRTFGNAGLDDRLRAPPQPGPAIQLRGRVRAGAHSGHPAGARATGRDRRRQPLRPTALGSRVTTKPVRLGLRENAAQFSMLVLINAFVGLMVGLERTVLPLIGKQSFHLTSDVAVLTYLVAFGFAKAFTNLAAGGLAARVGRRRLLIAGWVAALPVPLLIQVAPGWSWVVAANVFLGINQGLAWSM